MRDQIFDNGKWIYTEKVYPGTVNDDNRNSNKLNRKSGQVRVGLAHWGFLGGKRR